MTIEEVVELAKKINEYDPEDYDPSEPPICLQCGGEYRMETGEEPTALCDACAHAAAQAFAEIIEQRIKAARETPRERPAPVSLEMRLGRENLNSGPQPSRYDIASLLIEERERVLTREGLALLEETAKKR